MKLYFSFNGLPEVAKLTKEEKRIVWFNFVLLSSNAKWFKRYSTLFEWLLIGGTLVGVVLGCLLDDGHSFGALLGICLGASVPSYVCHLVYLGVFRKHLREYMERSDFRLVPVNDAAKKLIYPFTWDKH